MIPNNGFLATPSGSEVIPITLPEVMMVMYYLCNPGAYDPAQPWPKPLFVAESINQLPSSDSGWKNGTWGWVVEISWLWAYGDALIDAVYPPNAPVGKIESCPDESFETDEACPSVSTVNDETCPPDTGVRADTTDEVVAPIIDSTRQIILPATETFAAVTVADEDCPGKHTGNGCE